MNLPERKLCLTHGYGKLFAKYNLKCYTTHYFSHRRKNGDILVTSQKVIKVLGDAE